MSNASPKRNDTSKIILKNDVIDNVLNVPSDFYIAVGNPYHFYECIDNRLLIFIADILPCFNVICDCAYIFYILIVGECQDFLLQIFSLCV